MLQRIQTLFFLLAIVLTVVYLYSPVLLLDGVIPIYEKGYAITEFISGYFVFLNLIVALVSIGATLLAVFLFKYPSVQKLLALFSSLNMLFCFGFVYYKWSFRDYTFDTVFYYGNILPLVIIIINLLAIRGIIKDEELVKSYDRLR